MPEVSCQRSIDSLESVLDAGKDKRHRETQPSRAAYDVALKSL